MPRPSVTQSKSIIISFNIYSEQRENWPAIQPAYTKLSTAVPNKSPATALTTANQISCLTKQAAETHPTQHPYPAPTDPTFKI